jgi:hypothetical protein
MKQTKANLIANITQDLADNANQDISPRDVRQNMLDVVDSIANLLFTEEIVSTNFSTPATRTTIAGEEVLSKLAQESYVSTDNSAFGFAALKQNFQGSKNTAVGAYSLTCNVYGTDNVAVGYSALAGNSNGVANVGIGEYSLYYNKLGNMNVAIGHGAGYYADRESSSKLYIGVHPVTEQYVCDNPEGVGLTPLVHGDFSLGQFGVNVNEFHPYGSVQVSGAISPSQDGAFNLGHEDYAFSTTHTKGIAFGEGNSHTYDPEGDVVIVSGVHMHGDDIKPMTANVYSLGSPSESWRNTHTYNLNVYGTANINELKTITSCLYECKTLYLATSGVCEGEINPCGYLSSEELNGAGFVIPASGDEGLVNYNWTLQPSGRELTGLPHIGELNPTPLQVACFGSLTNVELSGVQTHVMAPQHLGRNSTIFGSRSEVGATSSSKGMSCTSGILDPVVFSNFDYIDANNNWARHGSNVGFDSRFVFLMSEFASEPRQEAHDSRRVTIQTRDYEVPASLNFQHSFANKHGVEFYSIASGATPGLFISTYDGTDSTDLNTVSIMSDDATGGVLGVHNFNGEAQVRLPETIINARSNTNAAIRVTAENAGNVSSSLELCGELNCLQDAGEVVYNKSSGVMVLSTYKDSGRLDFITMQRNNTGDGLGLLCDSPELTDDVVTIGTVGTPVGISLSNNSSGFTPSSHSAGYTHLYARDVDGSPSQSSELIYVDNLGNILPLSLATANNSSIFGDSTNTFGGSGCPSDRSSIVSASGNTAYGAEALSDTSSSSPQNILNTAIGYKSGYGLAHSTGNIVVGSESILPSVSGIQNNIVLGNNAVVSGDDNVIIGNSVGNVASSGSVIIGRNIDASGLPSSTLLIGAGNNVLLSGVLTASKPLLSIPSDGSFRLYGTDNIESTTIESHGMVVAGSGNRYGETPYIINFTGSGGLSNDLLTLDHSCHYVMTNDQDYETTNPRRPFMHIDGDIQVRGAIRMADGTSLTTASGVNNVDQLIQGLQDQIDTQTIEGTMLEDVDAPASPLAPTQGLMNRLDGTTETISIRDIYLRLEEGDYVIANRIMNPVGEYEYRPVWVSNEYNTCGCARPSTSDGGSI